MGLFSAIAKVPLAPVYGVMSLAEVIQRQVEQEMNNPANTRRQLEALEEARARGDISADEEREAQEEILESRVISTQPEPHETS